MQPAYKIRCYQTSLVQSGILELLLLLQSTARLVGAFLKAQSACSPARPPPGQSEEEEWWNKYPRPRGNTPIIKRIIDNDVYVVVVTFTYRLVRLNLISFEMCMRAYVDASSLLLLLA